MSNLLQDLRYGLRGLRRNPSFAVVAILSLALGIGATTAMFSVIYAVVLDAYPYADHQRTVNPIVRDPEHPTEWIWFALTPAQAAIYRQSPAFEDILGQGGDTLEMRGQDLPQDVQVAYLTTNDATFNRVPALLGRGIQASDDGKHNVAVLGYKFWIRRFHGDRGIVGRTIQLEDRTFQVVGVMPKRYTLGGVPDVYLPSTLDTRPNAPMVYFAKLKPGITDQQASAAVDPMVHEFARQTPAFYPKKFTTRLQYLIDPVTKGTGGSPGLAHTFPLIFLAVAMLLLIGCVNCSILLMARGTARTHEFAIRSAVGASRARIVRQLLVECLTISFTGAAIGIALSYFLANLPLKLLPNVFPTEALIRISPAVLGFSVAVAVLAGVLFGMLPAIRFSRPEISQAMQAGTRTSTGSRGARATLRTLISGQIALTLLLLAVAGAAIGGYYRLAHVPLGYDPTNTLQISGPFTRHTLPTWQQRAAYFNQLKDAIATTPGVLAVSGGYASPDNGPGMDIELIGHPSAEARKSQLNSADPAFFPTLHIPLLRGRMWTEAEGRAGLPLAVANQTFAKRFFPNGDAIGARVGLPFLKTILQNVPPGFDPPVMSPAMTDAAVQIIGVVGDTKNGGLDKPTQPALYITDDCLLGNGFGLLVHTRGDPLALLRAIQDSVRRFNPNQKLWSDPWTLQRMIEETPLYGQQRLISILFGIFAAAALALAIVGLYSVVAFAVAQRKSEFGIRMALGARRGSILGLVVRSTLPTVLGGTAVGLLLALLLRHASLRWSEGSSQSPLVLAGAALLLLFAGVAASLPPARRASSIDPIEALRTE